MVSTSASFESSSPINHVSAETRSKHAGPNASSLPTYNAVFVVDCQATMIPRTKASGSLQLLDEVPSDATSFYTFFEFVQPLADDTQSVSVTFTSSQLISLSVPYNGVPSSDYSAAGRVIRVFPTLPTRDRRAITPPMDVLLLFLENVFDPSYPHWRRDLMSCALVCRQWGVAVSTGLLFSDFRSANCQKGYPPDISKLTAALIAQPSNCRFIRYLSARYFEEHPALSRHPDDQLEAQTPATPLQLHLNAQHQRQAQCSRFADAFVSLLHLVKSVQTLCVDRRFPDGPLGNLLNRLPSSMSTEALVINESRCGYGKGGITMKQVLSFISTWPSIQRLTLSNVREPDFSVPLEPIKLPFTEINLESSDITDDELMCLIASSPSPLRQLKLGHIWALTNAGLASALSFISISLTHFCVTNQGFNLDDDEELALDTVISHLERLEHLEISPEVASHLMLERRARVFESRTTGKRPLPVVNLNLFITGMSQDNRIIGAAEMDCPGWKITFFGYFCGRIVGREYFRTVCTGS